MLHHGAITSAHNLNSLRLGDNQSSDGASECCEYNDVTKEQYLRSLPDCFNPFPLPAWAFVVVECECWRKLLSVDGTENVSKICGRSFLWNFNFTWNQSQFPELNPVCQKQCPPVDCGHFKYFNKEDPIKVWERIPLELCPRWKSPQQDPHRDRSTRKCERPQSQRR